jgi:hypothetical protein
MRKQAAGKTWLAFQLYWRGGPDVGELRRLYQLASKVEFCPGTMIFSEGEDAPPVSGLSKGYVRLYKNMPGQPPSDRGVCVTGRFPRCINPRRSGRMRKLRYSPS